MLARLQEKLEKPETPPELYDARRVEEEREMIENALLKTPEGEGHKAKIEKEMETKYGWFWRKDHASKLSKIRKYDLQEYRFKDIHKNPQNILVFNGKLLEFLKR